MTKRDGDIEKAVEKMARLARLRFDPAKLGQFTRKAKAVISYVEQLDELNTEGIDPTSHAADISTPLREDKAHDSGMQRAILEDAPDRDGDFIQVPKVLDGE